MSLTSILSDAVRALRDKIVNTAGSASPEDLAYMAKALEAIGGRVTIIEVDDYGQLMVSNLTTAYNAVSAALTTQANGASAALSAQTTASTTAIANATTTGQAALNSTLATAQAAASATASTLIQMGQQSPATMFLAYAAGR